MKGLLQKFNFATALFWLNLWERIILTYVYVFVIMYIKEGEDIMTNTNATNLRKNLFSYLDSTIEYNDIINVNTKKGNVIIISESEYNGLLETLYLLSDSTMKEKLEVAKNATDDDYEVFEW